MFIYQAIALHLGNQTQPIVTAYELGKIIFELYRTKKFQGEDVRIRKKEPEYLEYSKNLRTLLNMGIISPNKDFPEKSVFNILGRKQVEPEDVICSVDPFCYLSHLSAMAYHGISNREPQVLFITTPQLTDWKRCAKNKMEKDLKDYFDKYLTNGFPKLTKIQCNKIQDKSLNRYSSKHSGAFKNVKDRALRVSTIGRTFIDMVREPKKCSGIRHVVECYKNFGEEYSYLIISEAEQHANLIEKARIGYLLTETCGLDDKTLDLWSTKMVRGGSRKLDPSSEYSPNYSDKWCLSINL